MSTSAIRPEIGGGAGGGPGQGSVRVTPRTVSPGPVRLSARGRRLIVAIAILGAGALGMVGGRAFAATEEPVQRTVEVIVSPGESLWTIAQRVARPGEDLRDVVREIQVLNRMESVDIRSGDELLVPER
jgi:hypothetical protein